MKYNYTCSADPRARGKTPQYLVAWQSAASTLEELLQWAYVEGRAFAPGIFDLDAPLQEGEVTRRNSRLWTGSQLVVLDVDDTDGITLDSVKADTFITQHAGIVFPSSSYTPTKQKLHIVIPLTRTITDRRLYRSIGDNIAAQLSFTVDTATLNPAQAVYGTVFNQPEMQGIAPSLDDGLCWINPNATPVNPDDLPDVELPLNEEYTPDDLSERVIRHQKASPEMQQKVVIEALNYVLNDEWGEQEREDRLNTIMAAFQGCNTVDVLDAFMDYSSPRWDDSRQKATLPEWWGTHKPRVGGITVATLFAQARDNGWLQESTVELQGAEQIYAEEISDWLLDLEPMPPRVLLKSSTGTGKTGAAIKLLKRMQQDRDVRAVFFAPSIKLCYALSAALGQQGVTNTLYIENGRKTKDRDTLREAPVLVTTLQTFAVKAFAGEKTVVYDLVVMDECDELLSAFVRSGISRRIAQSSHVDSTQAKLGIDALIHLFQTSGQILMLDGTMTELTRYLARQWTTGIGVYENTFKRDKAPVTLYPDLQTIRDNIVDSVRAGLKTVIACDTKSEAALIEHLLILSDAVESEQVIRITGDTAADSRVNSFFRDVEAGADEYQVVIYNSAMGSGVSVVNTVPDVIYLLSTYLAPRKLIQMLNRYRRQNEVRAYIQARESLYNTTTYERYGQLQEAAEREAVIVGIERVPRSLTAQIVSKAALITATDDFEQHRSVRDFFINLLHDDGREVRYHEMSTHFYTETLSQVKEIIKQEKQELCKTWRSVKPIKRGDSFPDDMGTKDAARALLHGYIDDLFPHHAEAEIEDEEIARLALAYGRYRHIIKRWLNPENVIQTAVKELRDRRRESVTFRLYAARIELLTQVSLLLPGIDEAADDAELEPKALTFLDAVRERRAVYDLVAPANASYETLTGSPVQRAVKAARVILKSVGLGLKRTNGKRRNGEQRDRRTHVRGLDDLYAFSKLAGFSMLDNIHDFGYTVFNSYRNEVAEVLPVFTGLNDKGKQRVLDTMDMLDTPFLGALQLQQGNMFG